MPENERIAIGLVQMTCEPGNKAANLERAEALLSELAGRVQIACLPEMLDLGYDLAGLGPALFEEAARALLAVSPKTETALELMKHRLSVVRGRAILDCLTHAKQAWALATLEKGAAHALAWRVDD